MKKQAIKFVQRKAKPQVIHEFNTKGQHRLILTGDEGQKVSRWFERHQVGYFEGLLFTYGMEPLPYGVFKAQLIEHRTLPDHSMDLGKSQAQAQEAMSQRTGSPEKLTDPIRR